MKRFHPVISIFLGVICCFALYLLAVLGFGIYAWVGAFLNLPNPSLFGILLLIVSFIIGGFIATYFAKEKKLRYGLYEGVFITLILIIFPVPGSPFEIFTVIPTYVLIFSLIMVILLACVGSIFVLMMDKNYNGFSPIIAIIGGSVIGYSCMFSLNSIIGFNLDPNYSLRVIFFVFGVVSFVFGGFLSTFLAKEKKLQYGIYVGILITVFGILGLPTSIYHPPIIRGGAILLYIFSAVIGSYLAIVVAKHLQKT